MSALLLTLTTGTVAVSRAVNTRYLQWGADRYDGRRLAALLAGARETCDAVFSFQLPAVDGSGHHSFTGWAINGDLTITMSDEHVH